MASKLSVLAPNIIGVDVSTLVQATTKIDYDDNGNPIPGGMYGQLYLLPPSKQKEIADAVQSAVDAKNAIVSSAPAVEQEYIDTLSAIGMKPSKTSAKLPGLLAVLERKRTDIAARGRALLKAKLNRIDRIKSSLTSRMAKAYKSGNVGWHKAVSMSAQTRGRNSSLVMYNEILKVYRAAIRKLADFGVLDPALALESTLPFDERPYLSLVAGYGVGTGEKLKTKFNAATQQYDVLGSLGMSKGKYTMFSTPGKFAPDPRDVYAKAFKYPIGGGRKWPKGSRAKRGSAAAAMAARLSMPAGSGLTRVSRPGQRFGDGRPDVAPYDLVWDAVAGTWRVVGGGNGSGGGGGGGSGGGGGGGGPPTRPPTPPRPGAGGVQVDAFGGYHFAPPVQKSGGMYVPSVTAGNPLDPELFRRAMRPVGGLQGAKARRGPDMFERMGQSAIRSRTNRRNELFEKTRGSRAGEAPYASAQQQGQDLDPSVVFMDNYISWLRTVVYPEIIRNVSAMNTPPTEQAISAWTEKTIYDLANVHMVPGVSGWSWYDLAGHIVEFTSWSGMRLPEEALHPLEPVVMMVRENALKTGRTMMLPDFMLEVLNNINRMKAEAFAAFNMFLSTQ